VLRCAALIMRLEIGQRFAVPSIISKFGSTSPRDKTLHIDK
jgi:hypothetical protein